MKNTLQSKIGVSRVVVAISLQKVNVLDVDVHGVVHVQEHLQNHLHVIPMIMNQIVQQLGVIGYLLIVKAPQIPVVLTLILTVAQTVDVPGVNVEMMFVNRR